MPDEPDFTLPRAEVDHAFCVGVGECIRIAPRAFRYNKEKLAIFKGKGEGYSLHELREAEESCPMQAIRVLTSEP
jgi:ferredoxin